MCVSVCVCVWNAMGWVLGEKNDERTTKFVCEENNSSEDLMKYKGGGRVQVRVSACECVFCVW